MLAVGVAGSRDDSCARCFSPWRRPREDLLSPCRCCKVVLRNEDVRRGIAVDVAVVESPNAVVVALVN